MLNYTGCDRDTLVSDKAVCAVRLPRGGLCGYYRCAARVPPDRSGHFYPPDRSGHYHTPCPPDLPPLLPPSIMIHHLPLKSLNRGGLFVKKLSHLWGKEQESEEEGWRRGGGGGGGA